MLVGEVRCATIGPGCFWTLSGGSQLSSGPTKVSKNAHVRRARIWRNSCCDGFSLGAGRTSGRLSHPVMAGATSHSSRIGAARPSTDGRAATRYAAVASATAGATHIDRRDDSNPGSSLAACALYGLHSSSRRCETSVRQVVRITASALT